MLPVEELPARLREGETFPVVVTQVESPSKFCFKLQQTGYSDRVNDTMNRMDMFYTGVGEDMYRLVNTDHFRPGNLLAVRYQTGGFHSDLFIRVVDSSAVRVFIVDYRTVENQNVKNCRCLHKQFVSLPGQAIHARL